MKKKESKNVLILSLAMMLLTLTAQAAPGDLDTTFAGTGKVRLGFGGGKDEAKSAAQVDGKLVVAGNFSNGQNTFLIIIRYNNDGSFDTTFGNGGKVQMQIDDFGITRAVQIQTDGKIAVAVVTFGEFVVLRFNTDGSPDTTFDGDGMASAGFPDSYSSRTDAMILQRDGKIVVAGTVSTPYNAYDFGVVRFNTDGSLDTTFNGNGKVYTVITSDYEEVVAMTLQDDGKILVLGENMDLGDGKFIMARYTKTGALDTTFDGDGILNTQIESSGFWASAIAFEKGNGMRANPDRILVAGSDFNSNTSEHDVAVVCFSPSGGLNTNFGTNGKVVHETGANGGRAQRILLEPVTNLPDKIILAGTNFDSTTGADFMVARLTGGGSLDTTFDGDGIAKAALNGTDLVSGMTYQLGKIVLVGGLQSPSFVTYNPDFGIVRFNANGSLDTTFDGDGYRRDEFGNGGAEGKAAAIQTDGKIVVAGGSPFGLTVTRFNSDGTLDVSFNGNGKATTSYQRSNANAVAIQANGKIVAAGNNYNPAIPNTGVFVTRFNSNGSLDTTFSGDGIATTDLGSSTRGKAVGIQADGKIVVAGYTYNGTKPEFILVRYNVNGSPDPTFDGDGIVTTAVNGEANALAIQSDGKIVVAGFSRVGIYSNFAVFRYNSNGSLDTSFDGDGMAVIPIGGNTDVINAVSIQPNGKIVVAGSAHIGTNLDFALARFNPNGSLDTTFDGDGKITTPIGTNIDTANALTIQPDGKILVAGRSYSATLGNYDFAVVRYNADGSIDNSFWSSTELFGNDGKVLIDFNSGNDYAFGIKLDSAGRAVIVGSGAGLFGVVRLQGDFGASGFQSFGASGDMPTPNAFVP
jgi:uncharacterized delta-60 repeat protein